MLLGKIYTDDMIGQPISYSSNGQSNWIVFGKDKDGNILITTEKPIEDAFTLYESAESWLKYESFDDATYGLNYACKSYGGKVQGKNVKSRSITIDDINYVVGLEPKTVSVDGSSYHIQSFDDYTFGTEMDYENKNINYCYPDLKGKTNVDGTDGNVITYWKKPSSKNEQKYQCNRYQYGHSDNYYYTGSDTNYRFINASDIGINISNLQYVIGKITEERLVNDLLRGYLIASRNMSVDNERAYYNIMLVGTGTIDSYTLCFGETDGYYDDNTSTKAGIRPVVELPSSLLVYEKEDGTYDLVQK